MRGLLILWIALCIVPGGKGQTKNGKENIMKVNTMKNKKEVYLAGGCFWGTEHFMKQIRGVLATQAGYANSRVNNPTYQQVCSGQTDAAEAVRVVYDPEEVELSLLLGLYFKTIDPTALNRQGNDRGTQYRTGIYYRDSADYSVIEKAVDNLAQKYDRPLAIEVKPLVNFYPAEGYHQDYLEKNPGGYCHINPALFEVARRANLKQSADDDTVVKTVKPIGYQRPDDSTLRVMLTPEQYAVTQKNATEPPFKNEYWNEYREGIYVDRTTGEPLFISTDKFDFGCGWPSFSKPISKNLLEERIDKSYGMKRIEVRSKTRNAHLGHVFTDGPQHLGGLRYCINSASLRFVPKDQMKTEGYEEYLPLLEK